MCQLFNRSQAVSLAAVVTLTGLSEATNTMVLPPRNQQRTSCSVLCTTCFPGLGLCRNNLHRRKPSSPPKPHQCFPTDVMAYRSCMCRWACRQSCMCDVQIKCNNSFYASRFIKALNVATPRFNTIPVRIIEIKGQLENSISIQQPRLLPLLLPTTPVKPEIRQEWD